VRDIVKDALSRVYDGGISIEPHMAVVFHDSNTRASAEAQYANYIEYGRRLAGLIGEVERELQLA